MARSLTNYFLISWKIYLLIFLLALISWAISLPLGLFGAQGAGRFYGHWVEFLKNLSPSMFAAFVILLLTDYISKTHLERLFDEQKEGAQTTQEAFDWGLRLYPSHSNKIIKTRREVLLEYLEPGDEVLILSGNGVSWFTQADSILELLVRDKVRTRVVLFSPELYFRNLLSDYRPGHEEFIDGLARQLACEQVFSRYQTKGRVLINNHIYIRDELNALPEKQRARITLRYTGIIPLCEFFVVG
ncbi:MAG TPA: hypothetical protein VNZ44_12660, partial [Pyrinomonadaceae bacterium]|nr:hypothetical protein [Pyrinomonadaceae bacterium]